MVLAPCNFLFALDDTVAFVEDPNTTGTVLGRMEDNRGRHYEVTYLHGTSAQQRRRWFPENSLCLVLKG